jgi:hypothetical protein
MKISIPTIKDDRTIWRIELESLDASPGVDALWLNGRVRDGLQADLQAFWLAAVLGRFAAHQLTLPNPIQPELANTLTHLVGGNVRFGPIDGSPRRVHEGTLTGVLVRDELDFLLAELLFDLDVARVACPRDRNELGRISTNFPIATNAGWVLRRQNVADTTGELASFVAMAQTYTIGHIISFQLKTEFGPLDPVRVSEALKFAGIRLTTPFADLSLHEFRRTMPSIGAGDPLFQRRLAHRYSLQPVPPVEAATRSDDELYSRVAERLQTGVKLGNLHTRICLAS